MIKDLEIRLQNKPGTLALMGQTLGKYNISLEGGGAFGNGEFSVGHFLMKEPEKAQEVLEKVGIDVVKISDVIIQKLRQDVPGQLGTFCEELANAEVNILTQYSDHSNQLIIVPDNFEKARIVSENWMKTWWGNEKTG